MLNQRRHENLTVYCPDFRAVSGEVFSAEFGAADRVAILLCTYNGERFLSEQLDSLLRQSHQNWVIHASDDGSTDATLEILKKYQQQVGPQRLQIYQGPGQGFVRNFQSLLCNSEIDADYFAFCDQDDIWFEDRLARGLSRLCGIPEDKPALFCSRTRLVDTNGTIIGFSPLFNKQPTFANALVQSLAGANTMLFNRTSRQLLQQVAPDVEVVSHDWLAYLLVTGCDGVVIYDSQPTIDYRQHSDNLMGANSVFKGRVVRFGLMLKGTFRNWTERNLQTLRGYPGQLTADNQSILEYFECARTSSLFTRLRLLRKSGVYRQTSWGNAGLILATTIRRI